MKLKKESEIKGKENTSAEHGERMQSNLVINETNMNFVESEGKMRGETKVRVRNNQIFMQERDLYAREGEVKNVFYSSKPIIVLVYKDIYLNTNELDPCIPSVAISLL